MSIDQITQTLQRSEGGRATCWEWPTQSEPHHFDHLLACRPKYLTIVEVFTPVPRVQLTRQSLSRNSLPIVRDIVDEVPGGELDTG
jgi:hypothetical protein